MKNVIFALSALVIATTSSLALADKVTVNYTCQPSGNIVLMHEWTLDSVTKKSEYSIYTTFRAPQTEFEYNTLFRDCQKIADLLNAELKKK